ncbi:hypothetical protein K2173_006586 [Erythroxylum novogranatense]|uniref:Bromo domain-containing protein n=1 Tax=Erythroxylum novogranatense TaxID=1862640 RepID=A0AAV8T7C9_9ROSI|nr:hypothetical protein K2173_006586 [Erythroxylum novogranatense]
MMIAAKPVIAKNNLKIKISSRRIEAVSQPSSCEINDNEWNPNSSLDGSCHSQIGKAQSSTEKSAVLGAKRRVPSGVTEVKQKKRQKMGRGVTHQCSAILKTLMGHKFGLFFNVPVDPVKLEIPDYFSIISEPMDLGTIKSKLDKNLYLYPEEFAADVRLTFSNAMLYNPRENFVHNIAIELNEMFEKRWKSLEEKWHCEEPKFGSGKFVTEEMKEKCDVRQSDLIVPHSKSNVLSKRSKASEAKLMMNSSDTRSLKVKLAKPSEKCVNKSLEQNSYKGTDGGRHSNVSVISKPSSSSVASKCNKCDRITCQCSVISDSTHTFSDISSEGSLDRDHRSFSNDAIGQDCQAKNMSISQVSKLDPDSDGGQSALDEENTGSSSSLLTHATDATSGEGWRHAVFDVPLSPNKALRAAMLKKRFADTILKAQHKTLLDHGDKADPVSIQKQKELLEMRQREEKARIEAQIRAAEVASRMKKEVELKKQREKEREAARAALQKMERTVEIEENREIIKELEMLCGCSLSSSPNLDRSGSKLAKGGIDVVDSASPLERLGLFMKHEDEEDMDEVVLNGNGEEGEILA